MATKSRATVLKADITAPRRRVQRAKPPVGATGPKKPHIQTAHTPSAPPEDSAQLFGATDFTDKKSFWKSVHAHPAGYALVLFGLLLVGFSIFAVMARRNHIGAFNTEQNSRIVQITYDGTKHTVPTDAKTVGDLLAELRIQLRKGDRVEPDANETIVQDNFLVNVYRAEPVAVIDGATKFTALSAGATPRSTIRSSGFMLYPEDKIYESWQENIFLSNSLGNTYIIARATPINLELYSSPNQIRTQARTVDELLKEKKIKLTKDDYVKPVASTPITAGMKVEVNRNGIHTVTVTEDIAPPTETVVDSSLSIGATAVRQEGSPGKKVNTYEVNIQGGEEVGRRLVQSVTTVEPVKRVVARGNTSNVPASKQAVLAAAGVAPGDYGYVDYIFSHESGWNAAAASRNGYYGLGQTNLAKLSGACPNWQNDPVCQTRLFSAYAGRYGGWEGAYNFWTSHRWW